LIEKSPLALNGTKTLTVVDTTLISAVTRDKENPIAVGTSQALIAARPWGTLGQTENVARAEVFPASEDAQWITGLPLVIDAGYTVQ
jgi:NAD(P)-dependent dehydrogenase (short-subunit alcohol dehydrogenase family)